ncbi:helix-turn-helix domain-containing protein [Candidatus Pacearchaeota archaeon]|nr:helix-turn-helix domain-containing protein [Candidatus Pacearchaeota archaeon]
MDPIKEAFSRIKEEILLLREEISSLRLQIKDISTHNQTTPTHNISNIRQQTDIQTHNQTTPTHNHSVQNPYHVNSNSSIGNRGVPTDKHTDKQTHQQTQDLVDYALESDFKQANNILESLDNIKKGIRLKFKRLTPQEMLVFSHLYTLEEQKFEEITYKTLANKIKLSESSIRDYINKLINKGIPIDKIRQNNKTILLKVSTDLKKIATLATIQSLRSL